MRDARVYEERPKTPEDPRSPFERDLDRLVYAPQLRRLAAVTQVVGSHEAHLFHNRLTHTLKVAQFGKRLAERLRSDENIDPVVVESAGLAHDLGHPPFGHIAEEELDQLLVSAGIPDGFEGNAQSLRIVSRLATRPSGTLGLNLTRASVQALTKYPWQRQTSGKKHRKFGAYSDDEEVLTWSRQGVEAESQTPEAAIMDWADDVAYALHDLEDFCAARLIPIDQLSRDESEQLRFLTRTRERWEEQGRVLDDSEWGEHERVARNLFSELPEERTDAAVIGQFSSSKSNLFASGLTVTKGAVVEDLDMRRQLDLLKSMTWTYVIESPGLAAQQHGQRALIRNLFAYYAEARIDSLPGWAATILRGEQASRERVASDLVASLSETQAVELHARITGQRIGSVLDVPDV